MRFAARAEPCPPRCRARALAAGPPPARPLRAVPTFGIAGAHYMLYNRLIRPYKYTTWRVKMDETKKTLRVCYNAGVDDTGKTIVRKQSYSDIIPSVTNENLKQAAQAIGSLCKRTLMYAEVITTERIK